MWTTIDIPDDFYRRLKSQAVREGSSMRALILRGVMEVVEPLRRTAGTPVSLPIVRSKRPGSVVLDNARVDGIVFPWYQRGGAPQAADRKRRRKFAV